MFSQDAVMDDTLGDLPGLFSRRGKAEGAGGRKGGTHGCELRRAQRETPRGPAPLLPLPVCARPSRKWWPALGWGRALSQALHPPALPFEVLTEGESSRERRKISLLLWA